MLYTSCNSFDSPRRFCTLTFFDVFDVDRRLKVESSSADDIDDEDADDADDAVEAAINDDEKIYLIELDS
jgi:hypothetical protein